MPTTPRYLPRKTTVSTQTLKKRIEQTYLDTKPGSPLRSRLDQILQNRVNVAAVTAAKYYSSTLGGLNHVLKDPQFPVHLKDEGTRRIARPLSVPIRNAPLTTHEVTGPPTKVTATYTQPAKKTLAKLPPAESVILSTQWSGLGRKYAESQGRWAGYPKSISFWRKTGQLSAAYDRWWASNRERLSNPKNYLGKRKEVFPPVNVKGSRPRLARISFEIRPPLLNMTASRQVDAALRLSFARGKEQTLGPPRRKLTPRLNIVNKKGLRMTGKKLKFRVAEAQGLERLHSPEYHRPFAARYMAEMGRRYESTLRNVLKPR